MLNSEVYTLMLDLLQINHGTQQRIHFSHKISKKEDQKGRNITCSL